MVKWLDDIGVERDIVISSRIRLARNLKSYKFPITLDKNEASEIALDVKKAVEKSNNAEIVNSKFFFVKDIPAIERNVLIEKHLISPELSNKSDISGVVLSNDEKVTIMINEEDHIRLQILGSGLCLDECWKTSSEIDDDLEENLEYAFDDNVGYITSCPTNLGTGMRASVMLHLPALSLTNQTDKILFAASQLGIAVRGVYGEGTKSMGNLYQLSNQSTLGLSEEKIIDRINKITIQIIDKEKATRKALLENNKIALEDKILRSLGILKNAKIITTEEAMKLISNVKLGIELDLIKNITSSQLDILTIEVQPSNIQRVTNEELTENERDIKRAEIINKKIGVKV